MPHGARARNDAPFVPLRISLFGAWRNMERHQLALFDDLARKRKKSCPQIHKSLIQNLFRHHKCLRRVLRCPTYWLANTFRKFFTKEDLTGCPNKSRLNSTDLKWAASHGKRAGHGSRGFGTNHQCPAFDRPPGRRHPVGRDSGTRMQIRIPPFGFLLWTDPESSSC